MLFKIGDTAVIRIDNAPARVMDTLKEEGFTNHRIERSDDVRLSFSFVESIDIHDAVTLVTMSGRKEDRLFLFDKYDSLILCDLSTAGEENSEILVEEGIDPVFFYAFLEHMIRILLLSENKVMIHASAVSHADGAFVCFGWDRSGKSSLLLEFIEHGGVFIGDDRTILCEDGSVIPYYKNIRQFRHEIIDYPEILGRYPGGSTRLIRFFMRFETLLRSTKSKYLKRFLRLSLLVIRKLDKRTAYLTIPVDKCKEENPRFQIQNLFMINRSLTDSIVINEEPIERHIDGMVSNILFDDRDLMSMYQQFKFLFPDKDNRLLRNYQQTVSDIIRRALARRSIHTVLFPETCSIRSLYDEMLQTAANC